MGNTEYKKIVKYWQVIPGGTFAVVAKAEALLVIIMSRMVMVRVFHKNMFLTKNNSSTHSVSIWG